MIGLNVNIYRGVNTRIISSGGLYFKIQRMRSRSNSPRSIVKVFRGRPSEYCGKLGIKTRNSSEVERESLEEKNFISAMNSTLDIEFIRGGNLGTSSYRGKKTGE